VRSFQRVWKFATLGVASERHPNGGGKVSLIGIEKEQNSVGGVEVFTYGFAYVFAYGLPDGCVDGSF
jgi:hypothetical protein